MCEDADLKLILTEGASFCKQIPSFKGYVFGSEDLDELPAVTKEEIDSLDDLDIDDLFD